MLFAHILLWVARIVGGIVILSVGFTVVPELLRADPERGETLQGARQWLEFICFPVLALAGLAIAYWQPGIGGAVSVAGMALFFLLRPNLVSDPFMLAMWIPGALYLVYAALARHYSRP